MTPRPCRGGAGVGSVILRKGDRKIWKKSCADINTDPTPIPSPTGAGKELSIYNSKLVIRHSKFVIHNSSSQRSENNSSFVIPN